MTAALITQPPEPGRGDSAMSKNANWTEYDDLGWPIRAGLAAAIAASAGTTTVKNAAGRCIKIVVTAAGTSTDNATIYDGPAASGIILAIVPGGGTIGNVIAIDLPFATNLTVVNVTSGPAFTIGYC